MKKGGVFATAAVLSAITLANPAFAQLAPTFNPGGVRETQSEPSEDTKTSRQSVKLFDSRRTIQGFELDVGPVWYRRHGIHGPDSEYDRGLGELRLGAVQTTPWKPFYLAGSQQTAFTVFDSKSFKWSVINEEFSAGISLGPFQPEVRLGLALLTVDVFHGEWSGELLSPRVGVAVGLKLGKIRLDIQGYSEYLWRWFGPDYTIRGISLGVRLEASKPKPPPTM